MSDAANGKCGWQWQFLLSRRARIMMGKAVREARPGFGSRKGVFDPRNQVFVIVSKGFGPRWGRGLLEVPQPPWGCWQVWGGGFERSREIQRTQAAPDPTRTSITVAVGYSV